jgi:hypothetical protein
MKQHRRGKIDWALEVLGLSEPLREADVIDAMNGIRQSWEDVESPEAWETKRNAQEAGVFLLGMLEKTEIAADADQTADPLLYFVSEEVAVKVRKNEQIKRRKIILASALILAFVLAFSIPSAIQNRRDRMIDTVLMLRSTMNANNYETMELYLSRLNDEPRVEAVRADYELIREDIHLWMGSGAATTPAIRREAYFRLLAFDAQRPAWYLMGLLDLQGNFIPLIEDSRFEGEGMYFELIFDESDVWDLETNLPATYDSFKPYVLQITTNGRDYRLLNQNDEQDTVQLYRIQEVTQTQLTIYCYANARTYVLNRIGS